MDCSLPGSSVYGILQARIGHFLLQGIFPDPQIEPGSPALQAGSLPTEPPGKPQDDIRKNIYENVSYVIIGHYFLLCIYLCFLTVQQ